MPVGLVRQQEAVVNMKQPMIVRLSAAVLLLASLSLWMARNTGVHEVHRENDPENFPVPDARPEPGDWPWWRGTTQCNVLPFENPPSVWSPGSANGWMMPSQGRGRTGLCLWGGQIFLPTLDPARESFSLLSLDHATGRVLWQREVHREGVKSANPRMPQCSSTPACDGQHVFSVCSVHGSLWVTAVDLNGHIAWQQEVGPYFSKWGYNSSPVIHKSLVIVAADNKGARINRFVGASYLAALHRQTGEIVWRIHRPEADSFGTPVVAKVAGREQLLIAGHGQICSYNPSTGEELWKCRWSADRVSNSVAFDEEHVYASSRQPRQELICIKANGSGDVTKTHIVWQSNKSASDNSSPVINEGRLYTVTDDGVLSCLEAGTGQAIWKRRLTGSFSSSPIIAGQHLYCCNEDGVITVIRLGGRGEIVAEIDLGEGILASPVISLNRLFIRTLSNVHCIKPDEAGPIAIEPNSIKRNL